MDKKISPGEVVCLAAADGTRYLVRAEGGARKVGRLGILAPERLAGLAWGAPFEHGSTTYRLLRPSIGDITSALERKAQIVLPKDAARILFECDVRAGARVLEAGAGSGALTCALAWAVAPTGKITTYELRDDFAAHARKNVDDAGLAAFVEIRVADVTKGISERDLDAVVLDMPNPWDAIEHAREALRPDGHIGCYTPLVSQVEQTRRALERANFSNVRTYELFERTWTTHEQGARPDHAMLGHTAFLTFARKGSPRGPPPAVE